MCLEGSFAEVSFSGLELGEGTTSFSPRFSRTVLDRACGRLLPMFFSRESVFLYSIYHRLARVNLEGQVQIALSGEGENLPTADGRIAQIADGLLWPSALRPPTHTRAPGPCRHRHSVRKWTGRQGEIDRRVNGPPFSQPLYG